LETPTGTPSGAPSGTPFGTAVWNALVWFPSAARLEPRQRSAPGFQTGSSTRGLRRVPDDGFQAGSKRVFLLLCVVQVVSRRVPAGLQTGSRWARRGFQTGSRRVPDEFQTGFFCCSRGIRCCKQVSLVYRRVTVGSFVVLLFFVVPDGSRRVAIGFAWVSGGCLMFFVLPHGFQDVLQKGIGLGERWRRLVILIDSRNAWEHGGEAVLRQGMLGRMMGKMC